MEEGAGGKRICSGGGGVGAGASCASTDASAAGADSHGLCVPPQLAASVADPLAEVPLPPLPSSLSYPRPALQRLRNPTADGDGGAAVLLPTRRPLLGHDECLLESPPLLRQSSKAPLWNHKRNQTEDARAIAKGAEATRKDRRLRKPPRSPSPSPQTPRL